MRDDKERLLDILEAIDRIEKYAIQGRQAFEQSELIQNWMIRNLIIIGESVYKISVAFKQEHATIPWDQIEGMRHVLVHDYFEINPQMVWIVVEKEIAPLKQHVQEILKEH